MAYTQMQLTGLQSLRSFGISNWKVLDLSSLWRKIYNLKACIQIGKTTLYEMYREESETRSKTISRQDVQRPESGRITYSRIRVIRDNIKYRIAERRIRRIRVDSILYDYKVDSIKVMIDDKHNLSG